MFCCFRSYLCRSLIWFGYYLRSKFSTWYLLSFKEIISTLNRLQSAWQRKNCCLDLVPVGSWFGFLLNTHLHGEYKPNNHWVGNLAQIFRNMKNYRDYFLGTWCIFWCGWFVLQNIEIWFFNVLLLHLERLMIPTCRLLDHFLH